jgi:ectoine hydroxylase
MRLTDQQIAEFDDLGYLIMPDYFSKVEVAVLRSEAAKIYADDRKAHRLRRPYLQ